MFIGDMLPSFEKRILVLEEKFLKYPKETLFPLSWEALKLNRCPACGCKLYEMRKAPFTYCKSKKHKSFMISSTKLKELIKK